MDDRARTFPPSRMHLWLGYFLVLLIAATGVKAQDNPLTHVRHFMYQLQALDEDEAIEALAASPYDMLVLEPGHNFSDVSYDTAAMVKALMWKPDGSKRILLAYIDIGQAEDYRAYWDKTWRAPDKGRRGTPDFLITVDPDGWAGNYPVAYWSRDWKALWLGQTGIVAELAAFGFDGIYLDWVEAYDDDDVRVVARKAGISPEIEMITFVEELREAGRSTNPDFLVVAQNAPYLINAAPSRYAAALDGLAVEDTWFHGVGDSDWNDPDGGDQRDRHEDEYSTKARLEQIRHFQRAGLPVFSVDYALKARNVAHAYREAQKAGFIPLVTRVSLSRMTETPPPALEP
jgi:cysteinyl-tRNA synthetase, unknown class